MTARVVPLLVLLAACSPQMPTCKEAVDRAARRFGTERAEAATLLVRSCEKRAWPAEMRTCFADATTAPALASCLPLPVLKLAPSASVTAAVAKIERDPVRALAFVSKDSETSHAIEAYFAAASIGLEHHDRLRDAGLAKHYAFYGDGVVLVRGTSSEKIELDASLADAIGKRQIASLDRRVLAAVARLGRDPQVAYLLVGHGEVNDGHRGRSVNLLPAFLGRLGFEVRPLPSATLAAGVPADATLVIALAPAIAIPATEWGALARYLDRGGGLIYALDPTTDPTLDPKLGVAFDGEPVTDPVHHGMLTRTPADADLLVLATSQFTPHPTTTGLTRVAKQAMLWKGAGSLTALPAAANAPKVTFVVRSMDTAVHGGHTGAVNLAAAVEGATWRALVVADVDVFADVEIRGGGTILAVEMLPSSVRWLTHEDDGLEPTEPKGDASPLALGVELRQRELARALAEP